MTSFGNPNAQKMYKGSSADTAWNHDLLWKLRVKSENHLIGIKHEDNKPVHAQREVRLDTARSDYVRKQLESSRSHRPPPTASSTAMPREILDLERQIRDEIAKRERIEKKLMTLLETLRTDDGASPLPPNTKSGHNTRRVLNKISRAVAEARKTARQHTGRGGLPRVS
eukprot:INCI12058.1.p1 GENE.INCI12058.1~~INCI12058.1.p1  ORF type:complete len:169 (+),score=28.93 INCI12058.1:100-606(+)